MTRRSAVLVVASLALLAGCGGGSSPRRPAGPCGIFSASDAAQLLGQSKVTLAAVPLGMSTTTSTAQIGAGPPSELKQSCGYAGVDDPHRWAGIEIDHFPYADAASFDAAFNQTGVQHMSAPGLTAAFRVAPGGETLTVLVRPNVELNLGVVADPIPVGNLIFTATNLLPRV